MVEGARLESVYAGNRIEGSNPSLSANKFMILVKVLFSGNIFMAIINVTMDILKQLIDFKKERPLKIVSLGYPDILCSSEYIERLFGPDTTKGIRYRKDSDQILKYHGYANILNGLYESYELFDQMGVELTVLDLKELRGGEVIADFNYPISKDLQNQFDIVYDGGTLEHCFNIAQAIVNFLSMAKVGGFIYHANPLFILNHGFYNINPTFYNDFYLDNGHKLVSPIFGLKQNFEHINDKDNPRVDDIKFDLPYTERKELKEANNTSIQVVIEKTSDKTPLWPVQTKYKSFIG